MYEGLVGDEHQSMNSPIAKCHQHIPTKGRFLKASMHLLHCLQARNP